MLDVKLSYQRLLSLFTQNIILEVSNIAKILGYNLSEFTEQVGFSISAVSRIRKKIKDNPEKALENLPYALCMLAALDSIYLFNDIDINKSNIIIEKLLRNLCQDRVIFYRADGSPLNSNDFSDQLWFKIDYEKGQGFVYQMQYFINQINKIKSMNKLFVQESELLQKIQKSTIVFVVNSLDKYKNKMKEIKNYFEKCCKKDFKVENIYVSNVIKNKIYYGDIVLTNGDVFLDSYNNALDYVKILPEDNELIKDIEQWEKKEYISDCNKDLSEILNYVFGVKNSEYLLLFIRCEDDIIKILKNININYKDKIIFAYTKYFDNINGFKLIFNHENKIWCNEI